MLRALNLITAFRSSTSSFQMLCARQYEACCMCVHLSRSGSKLCVIHLLAFALGFYIGHNLCFMSSTNTVDFRLNLKEMHSKILNQKLSTTLKFRSELTVNTKTKNLCKTAMNKVWTSSSTASKKWSNGVMMRDKPNLDSYKSSIVGASCVGGS